MFYKKMGNKEQIDSGQRGRREGGKGEKKGKGQVKEQV